MNFDQTPFDRKQLSHLDKQLRELVDETYDFCLFKCTEKNTGALANCKQNCYKNIIVPYRFNNHAAKDEEDNVYRKCLSEKLPNIQHKDYIECTQRLYKNRVAILSTFMAETAESVLADIH